MTGLLIFGVLVAAWWITCAVIDHFTTDEAGRGTTGGRRAR